VRRPISIINSYNLSSWPTRAVGTRIWHQYHTNLVASAARRILEAQEGQIAAGDGVGNIKMVRRIIRPYA
jgi:hypothetical protein